MRTCFTQGSVESVEIPMVVPAECMTYFKPHLSISRWTSAIWSETEGDEVPICSVSGSLSSKGVDLLG